MSNPNAPADLARYAQENGTDLSDYEDMLQRLQGTASSTGKVFIDVELPFAEGVLARLRLGADVSTAVAETRDEALAALEAQQ